ncbi:AAA family ATPase [Thermoleptolyngbya sp. C42_A2020_037]|uniref:trifunctional serine/threonine-protein kinase/ATP-binding protein/sensor histidine kinase n=1 Tax=Thermoleptolyngbya sp. C42_A2020_037 TaxID=2747799 RepID=UPI001A044F3D|nr:AAA family ATPase [Thermoleptolyngbya sp. C42_A2020_037]MBF2083206.1 AAA family ATPase [Thermoleptolyngbya sp. C42_A2020_037]
MKAPGNAPFHAPTIKGYTLVEHLYLGSRTAVYRAVQTSSQQPVVIKVLRREYPTFSELVQFRNQYTIAHNLNIPGVVQPVSLESVGGGYALVMEDWGGVALGKYVQQQSLKLPEILAIALQLTDILHDLCQHRVVHKDLKPANILIHPETKQVKLIDFSVASLLPRETQEVQSPNGLEGTLAYLSPEQTGRMNRGIDYRSDFYSLGVTLFELLTGQLPFQSSDPMELMHCHLATQPPSVCDINPDLPIMLGEIVRKLMAKNAEDRYQSAIGLKHDLIRCQQEWQTVGKHAWFELGQRDVCDRFLIPEKLYGREAEVQILLEAFGRVANGASELLLVAGFSGIGKTAVVNEVHKPIVRWNGYFIKGKYDQFQRNIPFSAFVQAFRDLMGQLLSETDEQLAHWKDKILATVGENGQVLIEVIPELEQIIGKQPPAPELSGNAAQNRFNLLFQKFVQVFATPAHPLVMFLDDLQWADSASLNLIQVLMGPQAAGHLFIIGAYRDNEVFATHPLMLALNDIQKGEAVVNTLTLAPLSQADINQLIADTLSCEGDRALPLTELVYQKTKGNPFFTTQFLKALHEEKLITFDWQAGYWQCDVAKVRSLSLTDDVVEFVAGQLSKLPPETQTVLKLAACIGAQFDIATLAIVSEQSSTDTAIALWTALQEELILPTSQVYKFFHDAAQADPESSVNSIYRFVHDRVQQAAYSLIPEEQRASIHYRIGCRLLSHLSTTTQEERIFEIVGHLNPSIDLITNPTERFELARLNLMAGRKALSSNAYSAALAYLNQAIELLPEDAWTKHYAFTLELHHHRLDAAYLTTRFEDLEIWSEIVLQKATSLLDCIKVYETRSLALQGQGRFLEVIEMGLQILKSLGIEFPAQPTPAYAGEAFERSQKAWAGRTPLSLLDLPPMQDPNHLAAMQILTRLVPAAAFASPALLPLLVFKQVELSAQHGNCPTSIFSYADYGFLLCGIMGNTATGYEFGKLSLALLEKLQATPLKSRAWFIVNALIRHWQEPLRNSIPFLLEGYHSGLETGDWECVSFNLLTASHYQYWSGKGLQELSEDMLIYRQVIDQVKQETILKSHETYLQAVLNLLGQAAVPYRLQGEVFNADESLPLLQDAKDTASLFHTCLNQTFLCYLFEQDELAAQHATHLEEYAIGVCSFFQVVIWVFYDALIQIRRYPDAPPDQQEWTLKRVAEHQAKLQNWATQAPFNHQHRWQLVAAEYHRVLNQRADAVDLYDGAIATTKQNGFVQEEALANELAAKFYLDWGKERIAQDYLIEAYYGYAHWGAKAKVADLEHRYPQLLAPILQQTRTPLSVNETVFAAGTVASSSSSSSVSDALDLVAVLKASQTLSSEIELDKLLSTLLHTVMQTAGADKCVLMLQEDDGLTVRAIATLTTASQIEAQVQTRPVPVENSQDAPISLINSVKRSLQPAVITNATAHPQFATDVYIQSHQVQSVLCSPILYQGKLLGLVYLENNLTAGTFAGDRVELINLLCGQAAISLENARLYERSQRYAEQLEQSVNELTAVQARFHNLVDNVPGVVYQFRMTADGSLSLPYVSADCYDLYGVTAEEAIANVQLLLDRIHPEDAADHQQSIADSIQTLTPWRWEGRIVTTAGIVKWIHGEARLEKCGDGTLIWDGLLLDISERKRAELELKNAQLQIVQSEKMSALGNLVAGVAHEINNPVGFIAGNLRPALDYVNDLFGLIERYQQEYPNPTAAIQEEIETIDLEYIQEDLPKLIGSMQLGIDRIRSISNSLRTFSRADKDYKVPFDIHEGLDSTILILKHRLKANDERPAIQVVTNYSNLPDVECFPGQINQVFMNLLANAIDALDEAAQQRTFAELESLPQTITIQTALTQSNAIEIRIRDNGNGIPATIRGKIFDHLFTTKGVGKGTGLGLAIARQIVVEKHGGSLDVQSEVGWGTEFCIRLPMEVKLPIGVE